MSRWKSKWTSGRSLQYEDFDMDDLGEVGDLYQDTQTIRENAAKAVNSREKVRKNAKKKWENLPEA